MPAEREGREPVPGAQRRVGKWRPWLPQILLAAKFQDDASRRERIGRNRRGRLSELAAAGLLMAKGYRILGRRVRTPYGGVDLIAVRRRRIAFIEVKRRATQLDAQSAVSSRQADRIARAAEFWVSRNLRYRDHERGLDAVFVMPGRLPVHVPDSLNLASPASRMLR